MAVKVDAEIEEFRSLVEIPDEYEEGFGVKSMLGVLFVAFVMVPASMYLQLMTGRQLGGVVQWVTIILFAEVAKRSFTTLRRQEIYVLYYVIQAVMAEGAGANGFMWLIQNQYFVRSPVAMNFGIADKIPHWVVPPADSPAIAARTFFSVEWIMPIVILVLIQIINRFNMFGLGYLFFRMTSDWEKLPFPMAPMQALGITALAESTEKKETWRWRLFSVGAIGGMAFGLVYIGIPSITGAILPKPIMFLPIPWIDLTQSFESILPATPIVLSTNFAFFLTGTMLPFWLVIGQVLAALFVVIANPFFLHKSGFLSTWESGMDGVATQMANTVDFYMSFNTGLQLAVAFIGVYMAVTGLIRATRERRKKSGPVKHERSGPPPGRGDYPIMLAVGIFLVFAAVYAGLAHALVPNFPLMILVVFSFVISPLQAYVDARLVGLVGKPVIVPMVREVTLLLSGYKGVDVWFMPWPVANVGRQTELFRVVELTGTKISSLIKAEVFMVPIILATSFMFWSFIWKLAPIPSATYPFTQRMWPFLAMQRCIWPTAGLAKGTWCISGRTAYEFDDRKDAWSEVVVDNVLDRGAVNQIGLDPKGNRWFATDRGLVKYDGSAWTLLTDKEVRQYDPESREWAVPKNATTGLPSSEVLSVFIEERRFVWFGTAKGIVSFDGRDKWSSYGESDGMVFPRVTSIDVDKARRIWAGSDSGLNFYNGRLWSAITTKDGLLSNKITALATDGNWNAYVGTPLGLHRITKSGDVEAYTFENTNGALVGNMIRSLRVERVPLAQKGKEKEVIWIGTDKGVCRWDGEEWKSYTHSEQNGQKQGVPLTNVTGIAAEPSTRRGIGSKWFSTDTGIVEYDERISRWRAYGKEQGLSGSPVDYLVLSAGKSYLLEALRPPIIGFGIGLGLVVYTALSMLSLPVLLIYGFIGGFANPMIQLSTAPLMLLGALTSRFYLVKKYGSKEWRRYAAVIVAGFGCGTGLISMFGVAVALIAKSVSQLPF